MRLIDADKLIEALNRNFPTSYKLDNSQYTSVWGIPIIEAIPIDFLEKLTDTYFDLGFNTVAAELHYIIAEWRGLHYGRKTNDSQDDNTL